MELEFSILVSADLVNELIDKVRDYWRSSGARSECVSTIRESTRDRDRNHILVLVEEGNKTFLSEIRILESRSQL